jgi:hypothetical protein
LTFCCHLSFPTYNIIILPYEKIVAMTVIAIFYLLVESVMVKCSCRKPN